MKVAEGLARRAELTARMSELRGRMLAVAQLQEGDVPLEDPAELLAESDRVATELEELIVRINTTNLATQLSTGQSMTAALARRDVQRRRHQLRADLADRATGSVGFRATRSEIKMVSSVDVRALRAEADVIARDLRSLDTSLQEANWATDLL